MIGRQLSVLLVDDEELVRTATAEMIRDLGHDVEEAASGAEALALLDAGLRSMSVVTDYMMPGMDGGALARQHRANPSGARRSCSSPATPARPTTFGTCPAWPSRSAGTKSREHWRVCSGTAATSLGFRRVATLVDLGGLRVISCQGSGEVSRSAPTSKSARHCHQWT